MNILSIDPNEAWQKMIKAILKPAYCTIKGCNLDTKNNLDSALNSISANEYQLIILELILSSDEESDAYILLETLNEFRPNCAKIIITGNPSGDILRYNDLADAFFIKNCFKSKKQLIEEINKVVTKKKCIQSVKKNNIQEIKNIYTQKYEENFNMKIDAKSLTNNGIMADKVVNKKEVTFNNLFTEKEFFDYFSKEKKNIESSIEKLDSENTEEKEQAISYLEQIKNFYLEHKGTIQKIAATGLTAFLASQGISIPSQLEHFFDE